MTAVVSKIRSLFNLQPKPKYAAAHDKVDAHIAAIVQSKLKPSANPPIGSYSDKNFTALFCSNYPREEQVAHNIFCDAFGHFENDKIQLVALADGCSLGVTSQMASRFMVDAFISNFKPSFKPSNSNPETFKSSNADSMAAVQEAHQQMITAHKEDDETGHRYYGFTTFLGGQIFTANGKLYFEGVNCGDCMLFHLKDSKWVKITTTLDRAKPSDSCGRFGPNRIKGDRKKGEEQGDETEYSFQFEVKSGDKLMFITDGIHDNLIRNEASSSSTTDPLIDALENFPVDDNLGTAIMENVIAYTADHRKALGAGQDVKDSKLPGKPDHMTLLIVTVK